MSLTPADIQLIKEALKPEFNRIHKRLDEMELRITALEKGFGSLVTDIVNEMYELYTPRDEFNGLEKRVTTLENKPLRS